jgi:multidrug efflux pump subunit AcrA (membrane-fusion protein)
MAMTGFLQAGGDPLRGVTVPRSAVLRNRQGAWVYVQTDKASFMRRSIVLKNPSDDGWAITEGLSRNDRIVVTGAQVLLSEEIKSQIGLPE